MESVETLSFDSAIAVHGRTLVLTPDLGAALDLDRFRFRLGLALMFRSANEGAIGQKTQDHMGAKKARAARDQYFLTHEVEHRAFSA